MSKNSRPVYSTETGRIKDTPSSKQAVPEGDGIVRLKRETKGRKGKGVTLVTGVLEADDQLKALAKSLKQHCGVGGSVKNGVIEVQTDDRERIQKFLTEKGYTVKIAGG